MEHRITINAGSVTVVAEMNDSSTAEMIWAALPITGRANTWGDEIYLEIPVEAEQAADARADVAVGELGYWPVGRAFCIFFGPTPVSSGDRPRAASPVNVVGQVLGDATVLRDVRAGVAVTLKKTAQ